MDQPKIQNQSAQFYADNAAYLADELRRVDLLIARRMTTLRRQQQETQGLAANKGVYITHEEVEALLNRDETSVVDHDTSASLDHQLHELEHEINNKIAGSCEQETFLSLPNLAYHFGLSPFEVQAVMICLAPELDTKYDTLYAYLQDDITRKKPSVDLILDLLSETRTERWHTRPIFSDQAPLLRFGILNATDDAQSPSGSSGLARFLQIDPRILNYILCHNESDMRLDGYLRVLDSASTIEKVLVDQEIKIKLSRFIQHHFDESEFVGKPFTFYFHGPHSVGKRELALGLCQHWGCPLIYVDIYALVTHAQEISKILPLVFREGLLLQAPLYIDFVDTLCQEDGIAKTWVRTLGRLIAEHGRVVFMAGEKPWNIPGIFEQKHFCSLHFPIPNLAVRQSAWESALRPVAPNIDSASVKHLASQFRLTPAQIDDAVAWSEHQRIMQGNSNLIGLAELYAGARNQSHHTLGERAIKIEPRYDWKDLILPDDKLALLKEICAQVKHRYMVFSEWGFDNKLSHGKGLSVLFAGSSGTGKTMSAEIMAGELGLDLYKVDLSGVVSKYIGETEKNLSKIFHAAETSNAILFFDEADALFGKRTKVTDAHDRYANIETSYLLQKIEMYEGMVILATNLRDNLDQAFTRRIRFLVDFPVPDAESRERIWRTHFPPQAPIDSTLDYQWLATKLPVTGGNIKNIALNAAFLAAEEATAIKLEHVLQGAKREFEKTGKVWKEL